MAWTTIPFNPNFKASSGARDNLRVRLVGDTVEMPTARVGSKNGTPTVKHMLTQWVKYPISGVIPAAFRPALTARGPLENVWFRGSARVRGFIELEENGIFYVTPDATVSLYGEGNFIIPPLRWLIA